jgi:hypothetical protein
MSEHHARPDVDIEEDVNDIIVTYPPLAADRHHIHVTVQSGVVVIDGHVRTPINRRVLIERTSDIPGVAGINADEFFDDETIRLQVGKLLPYGIYANPAFGVVALTGKPPVEPSVQEIIQRVARVPGVVRVVAALGVAHGA